MIINKLDMFETIESEGFNSLNKGVILTAALMSPNTYFIFRNIYEQVVIQIIDNNQIKSSVKLFNHEMEYIKSELLFLDIPDKKI